MTTEDLHQNLLQLLELIGLKEEEARVYLACLELGPSSVWNIFLKSGIKRPTCYVILDNLVSRGLASKSLQNNKAIYAVSNPMEIAKEFDRKKSHFEANLSQFDALASKASEKPLVRLYEGEEGIKQAYNISLNEPEGTEMLVCSNEKVLSAYPNYFESYIKERVRKGIKVRMLLADMPNNRIYLTKDKEQLRKTRFLPQSEFDPRGEMEIYNNKIVEIAYSESTPFATVIESSSMAFDERQKFELLWQIAKERY